MSGSWQVRFEIVAGPNDGLTFAITDHGVVLDGELQGVPPDIGLEPKDLDDVEIEVGDEGVTLTCEVDFWLNGAKVTGAHLLREDDVVRVGMTEMVYTGFTGESTGDSPSGTEGGGATATGGTGGGAAEGAVGPARRCLRPGCGAMNPPDAKWCLACGWDLDAPG